MKRGYYVLLANAIFVIHAIFFAYALFGWIFQEYLLLYIAILTVTLVHDLVLGYCILSKWEFDLRKKVRPEINYPYNFSSYYTDKLLGKYISPRFIDITAHVFLIVSITTNSFFVIIFA